MIGKANDNMTNLGRLTQTWNKTICFDDVWTISDRRFLDEHRFRNFHAFPKSCGRPDFWFFKVRSAI